jgi:hypothetical protein
LVDFDNYLKRVTELPPPPTPALRHLNLVEQIGVTIQHFEQIYQGNRRLKTFP